MSLQFRVKNWLIVFIVRRIHLVVVLYWLRSFSSTCYWVAGMAEHNCTREDCKPANVNGPKVNCVKCNKICFLLCHGSMKHGNDFVKFELPNDSKAIVSPSSLHWACQNCQTAGIVLTAKGPMISSNTSTPPSLSTKLSSNNKNDKTMINAINEIKEMIAKNQEVINDKLDEIGPAVFKNANESRLIMLKLDSEKRKNAFQSGRDLANNLFGRRSTKNNANAVANDGSIPNQTPSRPSYATILQKKLLVTQAPSSSTNVTPSKRKCESEIVLIDNSSETVVQREKVPTPKNGLKIAQIGKPLEPRKIEQKKINPLTKSIRVAGFHPDTTTDELEAHIIANSTIADKTKFKCTKLVKKDQDISKMSFISFKIDVSPGDFDALAELNIWPQHVNVREFVNMTLLKSTLGQFVPRQVTRTSPTMHQSKVAKTDNSNENLMNANTITVEGDIHRASMAEEMETDQIGKNENGSSTSPSSKN